MSKIAITGAATGTATFTIESPATSTNRTLTIPDATGTIDTLQRAGNVLQVVQGTTLTAASSSSSTFADTGLTATITPTSATSKVLVLVTQTGCGKNSSDTSLRLRLQGNGVTLIDFERSGGSNGASTANFFGSCSVNFLDSPATLSAITYKTQFASGSSTTSVFVQTSSGGVTSTSTITLMEIAA